MEAATKRSEYDEQTEAFKVLTGLTIGKRYLGHWTYFQDDKEQRAVWEITLTREGRKPYTFTFGESIHDSYVLIDHGKRIPLPPMVHNLKGYYDALAAGRGTVGGRYELVQAKVEPSDYSILACLDSNAPDTFHNFCLDFGYDEDSRKALAIYLDVEKQAAALRAMFTTAELEQLGGIS